MEPEKLKPNDPLNRRLMQYAQAFNDLYAMVMGFVDGGLRQAADAGTEGSLDFKLTVDRDKLIVRRRLRKAGEPAPTGIWRHLPVDPETVAEFFERVKPEEPKPSEPLDIDASAGVA